MVGASPGQRDAQLEGFSRIVNGPWYGRIPLTISRIVTQLTESGMRRDGLLLQHDLIRGLSNIRKTYNTPIQLLPIDAHEYTMENASVATMRAFLGAYEKLLSQDVGLIFDYDLTGPQLHEYIANGARQALGASRYSFSTRDTLVRNQLQNYLHDARPDDLHLILTGSSHKPVARAFPDGLRQRRVITTSEEILSMLPDEFRSIAVIDPTSYALARMERYEGPARDEDVNRKLLGDALEIGIGKQLEEGSSIYAGFSEEDRTTISNLLAVSVIHTLSAEAVHEFTESLFTRVVEEFAGEEDTKTTLQEAITAVAPDFWNEGFTHGRFSESPLVAKAYRQLLPSIYSKED